MASSATSLYGIAAELLAKSAAILAGTPAGAIGTKFVCHGPPAYDCPNQLTVHAGPITYGPERQGAEGSVIFDPKMHVVIIVPLTVTALRCVRTAAMPQGGTAISGAVASAIDADAQVVYADGWSLFCGLRNAQMNGTLFAGWPCRPFEVTDALPISPDGGVLGWAITVTIQLDGFDPPGE